MEFDWWEFGPPSRVPPVPDNLAAIDALVITVSRAWWVVDCEDGYDVSGRGLLGYSFVICSIDGTFCSHHRVRQEKRERVCDLVTTGVLVFSHVILCLSSICGSVAPLNVNVNRVRST